jgi:dsDNA-specific endonuclease/ATPase MutS2
MIKQTYETDFLRWTQEQSALLRAGKWAELDQEHIAEELEDMGREQKLALQSLLRQILLHLIKLQYSPASAPRSKWTEEIIEFRDQAQARIDATPSLKHHAPELFDKAWQQARRAAQRTFELHGEQVSVPDICPYSIEQALDPDYFPGSEQQTDR